MFYVDASYTLLNVVEHEHTNLIALIRELTGEKMRRVDRYTLLALAGAMQCGDITKVRPEAAMVLATQTGTLSTTIDMMHKIGIEKQPPKPFQFVNSLGNSACYSLANMMNIHGPSLAVSRESFSFESGLEHADLLMHEGLEQVIVGGIDEAPLPISDHLMRHLDDTTGFHACYEGSHWLRLNKEKSQHSYASVQLLGEFDYRDNAQSILAEALSESGAHSSSRLDLATRLGETVKIFSNSDFAELEAPAKGVLVHGTYSGHCFVSACEYLRERGNHEAFVITVDSHRERVSLAHISSLLEQ